MTITDVMLRLSVINDGKWLWKLLKGYEPLEIVAGEDKGKMTGPELYNLDQLEYLGDLEEIDAIITSHHYYLMNKQRDQSPLLKFKYLWDFIKAAEFVCEPNDLEHIPAYVSFQESYPLTTGLMITWAWG